MTIVSLSVRYASATVDEFIEHHALDVNARGIYIKTERAIPLGTLIDFEVRIGGNQTVLAGAGRVMWIRDAAASTADKPRGIGVRFIELDEPSKALLEDLLKRRPEAGKKYEEEAEVATSRMPTPPPPTVVTEAGAGTKSIPPPLPGAARRSSRPKPLARRTLPPVAAPPRRSTVPPPSTNPPDDDGSDGESTQLGPIPVMPKGRKATLVGIGAPKLPRVVAPPRRRSSRPPPAPRTTARPPPGSVTPPPPPPISLPPPRPPESRPAPKPPAVVAPPEEEAEDPTLLQPMGALLPDAMADPAPGRAPEPAVPSEGGAEAESGPDSVPVPIDVDNHDAEPTVIVARDGPISASLLEPIAEAPPTETTAPQSMQEVHGLPPDVPRDLGDTQRIRRRGRRRRMTVLGVIALGAAGLVGLVASRHTLPPEPVPAATSSSAETAPTESAPSPALGVTAPPSSATTASEAGPEASASDEAAAVPAPSASSAADAAATWTETPAAAATPTAPTQASGPAPVPIEFSALPIERPTHPPKRVAPDLATAPATANPTGPATAPPATATKSPPVATKPAAAAPATPSCNPTYTLDADGNKHFKPECFSH